MRVRWTTSAKSDLESVGTGRGLGDVVSKPETVIEIFDAVEELVDSPATGKAGMVPGTRELTPPGLPLVVVYKVEAETLQVLRVLPGGDY